MKKQFFKINSLIIGIIVICSSVFAVPSQAASNDFSMKSLDKAYVTFIFDDGRMPFTKQCFEYFKGYNMPMTCSLVAKNIQNDQDAIDLFKQIEKAGGEIYSHTYDHVPLTQDNCTLENIEKQLGDSYRILTGLGFDINGIIETGNGGYEGTANYELIETVSRKYYKYSNAYGVSAQYKFVKREPLSGYSLEGAKKLVDDAIQNKTWLKLWAHDFSEFSDSNMNELLKYISSLGKNKVQVVTSKHMYDTFGNYTGLQVPTTEAKESVCATQGHNLKNATVVTAATCEKGAVMKGECERCGKTTTSQSEKGALGHKFDKYVSDNNGTCQTPATKTAKCSNSGCNVTNTVEDSKGARNHDLKSVVIKEATADAVGLAEIKCALCGYLEKKVVIPKGKKAEDVVSSELKKNETSNTTGSNEEQDASNDEASTNENGDQKEKDSNNTNSLKIGNFNIPVWLIIVLIVSSVLLLGGIGVAIFFIVKNLKS